MASYTTIWVLFGILMVQQYAFADEAKNSNSMSALADDDTGVDQQADDSGHNLHKRYLNGLTGDDDMGFPSYSDGFGYAEDPYPDFPAKRHASRWALIHRKLAERERHNAKRYNYVPMEAFGGDEIKRSPSRWRFVHRKLKELQKREASRNRVAFAN